MAEKYIMKQYDLEPSFEVQLLDGIAPIDLTSAVGVLFLMKSRKALKVSGPMTVADQTVTGNTGVVRYDWLPGDTYTVGTFSAEIQVTWPGSPPRPQTFPADGYVLVDIQKDLGPIPAYTATFTLAGGGSGDMHAGGVFDLSSADAHLNVTGLVGP